MVYHDYDEEDHAFDDHPPDSVSSVSSRSVSVGQVGDKARAGRVTLCLRKKCLGIPIVLLLGLLVVAISVTALVASHSASDSNSNGTDQTKGDLYLVESKSPTPQPTPHPTKATKPTVSPSQYPTHAELGTYTEWVQLGNDVGGIESAEGNFGISVGVSGDGKVFAEGAHMAIGKDAATGHVRVYKYNEKTFVWEMRGHEILGDKRGDEFGYAIDLSRSGDQIAIGAPGADRSLGQDYGYFAVYHWNTTIQDWCPMGPDKWGEHENERAGHDVTISEDGGVLVIGAPGSSKMGQNSGEIRVFEYMPKTDRWLRRGQDLHGEKEGDQFGASVAVSDDGNFVAAGSPYNSDAGYNAGSIRVFAWIDKRFHKLSRTLTGRDPGDNFGYSVACNENCHVVAGGAPTAPLHKPDGTKVLLVGYVDVYKFFPDEDKWHKLGHPIYGEFAYEGFGKSVELSADGHTLIVGSPDVKNSRGSIRVFQFQPDTQEWINIGRKIEGDGDYDFWGSEVAASEDGKIIVSGGNNFKGLEKGAGHVRVYRGV